MRRNELLGTASVRVSPAVGMLIHERCNNSDQFVTFFNYRILIACQVSAFSKDAQPVARLFCFAQRDLSLRKFVTVARTIVGFLVVRTDGGAALKDLIRKCLGDGSSSVQEFH